MTLQASESVVRHSVEVEVPVERAFEVFVGQGYVNTDHHLLDSPVEEVVLEGREGGRWYERSVDGRECDWGRVLVYEPPGRLVLSWAITPNFTPEPDPSKASEVEVRFTSLEGSRTRVELEHRELERHGEGWEQLRAGVDGPEGWPDELRRLAEATRAS